MILKEQFSEGWYELLQDYLVSSEFNELGTFINERSRAFEVELYPKKDEVFRAFRETPLDTLKCVIIGYEPYNRDCSNGIAFGHNGSGPAPKTTSRIYRKWEDDVHEGLDLMFSYSLKDITSKGVLMLNLALTRDNRGSHINEWKPFTINLFKRLSEYNPDIIYVIWDKRAMVIKPLLKGKVIEGMSKKPFTEIELLTDIKF